MVSLPINEHVQRSNLGGEVVLVEVDLTKFGENIIRLAPVGLDDTGTPISFGGNIYTPHPMELDGFEVQSGGPYPTPSVLFENTGSVFTPFILQYRNLLGAEFRRIRTFERFLDDGEEPDPYSILSEDIYSFDELATHNRTTVGWKLSSAMDQRGAMLPGRMVVRDYCPFMTRYTEENGSYAGYDRAECPYTGAQAFDEEGQPTSPEEEVFSKTLETCCYPRFGKENPLPFGGFPGVARFRG